MSARLWSRRNGDVIAIVLGWAIVILVVAAVFGLRLWIAGGDWGCMFSPDPALCVAVKGIDR